MKLSKKLILASNSPRRKEILKSAGFDFEVIVRETEESFDSKLELEKVPEYLAKKKADCFGEFDDKYLILTADTVVISDNKILNKPKNNEEAFQMLSTLSCKWHKVVTGVCMKNGDDFQIFSDETEVYFESLSESEINFYIENFKPLDKAGAYGVQDFIGMIGISKLNGSFYTVMGLPIHKIYHALKPYIRF